MRSSSARTRRGRLTSLAVCGAAAGREAAASRHTAAKASMPAKRPCGRSFAHANESAVRRPSPDGVACHYWSGLELEEADMTETLDVGGTPMIVKRTCRIFLLRKPVSARATSCRPIATPTTRRVRRIEGERRSSANGEAGPVRRHSRRCIRRVLHGHRNASTETVQKLLVIGQPGRAARGDVPPFRPRREKRRRSSGGHRWRSLPNTA